MKFSEVFTSKDKIQLDKRTLVILRWIAIIGQYLTISIVYFILKFELPFFYCSIIIFAGVITNFYLQLKVKENQLNNFTSTIFLIKSSEKAKNSIKRNSKEYNKLIEKEKSKINMQRFKGLGEMNPEELWETTLNPEKRTLLQIKYSNNTKAKSKKDQDIIQILMGDEVAPRKDFIINRALDVSNLDI